MTTIHAVRSEIEALRTEARSLVTAAGEGAMDATASTRFDAIEARVAELRNQERRLQFIDSQDRAAPGTPVGGQDPQFERFADGVGILDAIRAGMGGTDHAAGRAREVSQELERRSGRKANGILWSMGAPTETRVLTTTAPGGGPGSNIIGPDYRPDQFIDRLRNATRVRGLGATMLMGLQGGVTVPRRKASVATGWVAENSALSATDPQFDGVTLSPKHAGAITEWSRNLILQSSPDVEALARDDFAKVLAEVLDSAAISGTGTSNMPAGVLSTSGVGQVAAGTNGAAPSYDMLADLVGQIDDANADGSATGFLTNTKVRRALVKLKDTQGHPLGLDVVLQGKAAAYTNLVPSNGTKGSGTNLSSIIYVNWSDLLIGVWSEIDLLVNPYESTAYSKGNIQIRAMMTVDIAVRHAASFAAITDLVP